MSDLDDYLQKLREQIDAHLNQRLRPQEGCPERLSRAMRYSLLAPGKRIRPLFTVLSCEVGSGRAEAALPAACAVEMIHTYSLIHDDLPAMDDDDTRRGRPTSHKEFDEATAILAGDALLTLAFEVIADSYAPKTAVTCCRELARAAGMVGMVGGQADDLAWEKDGENSHRGLTELEGLHARKTGALINVSLTLGAWAAQGERNDGPDPRLLQELQTFGRCLGLAFQITDDLLDVEGDAVRMGKGVQKDADRGKLTYPQILGVEESRRRAEMLCQKARDAVAPLGPAGQRLSQLALYVLRRDR